MHVFRLDGDYGWRPTPASLRVVRELRNTGQQTMKAAIDQENAPNPADLCTVVVVYDDVVTRARALNLCDYLVSQIWESVELDFHWWRTDFLKDSYMARAAAHHAIMSDFLVVCSREISEFPTTLETWFESWIGRRENREGVLIDLTAIRTPGSSDRHRQNILREIARRGKFEYLIAAPETSNVDSSRFPEKPAFSAALPPNDRFGNARPPSRFGLNE